MYQRKSLPLIFPLALRVEEPATALSADNRDYKETLKQKAKPSGEQSRSRWLVIRPVFVPRATPQKDRLSG